MVYNIFKSMFDLQMLEERDKISDIFFFLWFFDVAQYKRENREFKLVEMIVM